MDLIGVSESITARRWRNAKVLSSLEGGAQRAEGDKILKGLL